MAAKAKDVAGYVEGIPEAGRSRLAELRDVVAELSPNATEHVSYGMLLFKHEGQRLVHFGVWKDHCAVYGLDVRGHADDLARFDVAKGTIRFPLSAPLPRDLLSRLLSARLKDIAAGKIKKGEWPTPLAFDLPGATRPAPPARSG